MIHKNPHAVALGRLSKGKTSAAKALSSKKNGQRGGRPPQSGVRDWNVFMNAIDQCRRENKVSFLHHLFLKSRITRERALIHSSARYLSRELGKPIPRWASGSLWLKDPWFVSGVENLKAMALIESPLEFRSNHIFVLGNFLSRV